MYEVVAILSIIVFLYAGVSAFIERTPFSGALVFVSLGLLLGPLGLGFLDLNVEAEGLGTLAELTLALVLFTDAARTDLRELAMTLSLPRRLLLAGLPLTILLGFLCALPLFGALSPIEIGLLAVALAPTDAALGKAVVTDVTVPNGIRTSLNVESGLNDGICVPIFLALLALATHGVEVAGFASYTLVLVLQEIGVGIGIGLLVAAAGAILIRDFSRRNWITRSWLQLPVPALALVAYAAAQNFGGSGFIASFCAGLLFGGMVRAHKERFLLAAESTGDTLALVTWVAFGATAIGTMLVDFDWRMIAYAVLSLTAIRIVPVWLALRGSGMAGYEKFFVGWFGPRGLASVVFAVMVLQSEIPGSSAIVSTAACTILLSVVAHGITARPYARYLAGRERESGGSGG